MTFEEFEIATDTDLRAYAKDCFDRSIRQTPGPMEIKAPLMLEAQFYISEIERRKRNEERDEDNANTRRSHRAESAIIWLIVLELAIAAATLGYTIYEGHNQAAALAAIEKAADNTAKAAQNTAHMVIVMQSRMAVPFTYSQATSTTPKSSSKSHNLQ